MLQTISKEFKGFCEEGLPKGFSSKGFIRDCPINKNKPEMNQ